MLKWIKGTWNEIYFENSYSYEMKLLESEIAWKVNCLKVKECQNLKCRNVSWKCCNVYMLLLIDF